MKLRVRISDRTHQGLRYLVEMLAIASGIAGLWAVFPNLLLFALLFIVLVMILMLSWLTEYYNRRFKYYDGVVSKFREYLVPEVQTIASSQYEVSIEPSGMTVCRQEDEIMLLTPLKKGTVRHGMSGHNQSVDTIEECNPTAKLVLNGKDYPMTSYRPIVNEPTTKVIEYDVPTKIPLYQPFRLVYHWQWPKALRIPSSEKDYEEIYCHKGILMKSIAISLSAPTPFQTEIYEIPEEKPDQALLLQKVESRKDNTVERILWSRDYPRPGHVYKMIYRSR